MKPSSRNKRRPGAALPGAYSAPAPAIAQGPCCACTPLRLLGSALLLFLLARLAVEARIFLAPLDATQLPPPPMEAPQLQALAQQQPHPPPPAAAAAAAPPAAPPAARAAGMGSSATALSQHMLRTDSEAGSAAAHALPGEAFNLVTIERTEALRSSDRVCQGAACLGQRFFLVEQQRASSDAMLDFLHRAELRVMEVFAAVLASEACQGVLHRGATPWCAHQHPLGAAARPPPFVLDIGSNSGFYTQLSARLGAQVLAIDPQPHCLQYVRVAASLNGAAGRVLTLNAFAGSAGLGDAGDASAPPPTRPVLLRTGCWGMFPHDKGLYRAAGEVAHRETREEYDAMGGNASVAVPVLSLPALLAQLALEAASSGQGEEGVLLAKVDVEGSELELARGLAASGALAAHHIKNFVMELNKYAVQSEGPACIEAGMEPPMGTWPCFAELLGLFQGAGYVVMVHSPWGGGAIDNVTEFAASPWREADVWLSLPR